MAVSQKPKLIRITLDIKERARPLLQKMLQTVERHGNKSFRNYSLTASLEVFKSLDSFGLFMLLRRASSRLFFLLIYVCAYSDFWRNISYAVRFGI